MKELEKVLQSCLYLKTKRYKTFSIWGDTHQPNINLDKLIQEINEIKLRYNSLQ
jgi:hypothetical protein